MIFFKTNSVIHNYKILSILIARNLSNFIVVNDAGSIFGNFIRKEELGEFYPIMADFIRLGVSLGFLGMENYFTS